MATKRFVSVTFGVLALVGLTFLSVMSAEKAAEEASSKKITTEALGGAERFLAYLSTDKPIYRAGEKVYLRGVVLNAANRTPLDKDKQTNAVVEIKGPKGDVIASGNTRSEDSVLGFAWKVPEGSAGGQYTARFTFPWEGHPPAERKFEVRAYRAPRLKSQIVFVRDGYGPGDTVSAGLHVERAEGGIPADAKVTVTARVDGIEVFRGQTLVGSDGNASTRFELPDEITRGEGTLAWAIEDGGVVETATKTIPILLQTVDLKLYPEGGELVAGLPARVYISARTPAQKPADISGEIVDSQGNRATGLRTEHEGRGRSGLFVPKMGETYTLRITKPSGIKTTYDLPGVKDSGVIVQNYSDVSAADKPVYVRVASTSAQRLTVTLSRREKEIVGHTFDAKAGVRYRVKLTPPEDAEGVLIATVWDSEETPLAERLVFRSPRHAVNVSIEADQSTYVPGGQAELKIKTTDENGKPVAAVVGLTVTDDSVLEMIEKREQAPRLPVMVLLENDVDELADAHVYLDPANDKAPLAVDRLLGTQGWRRFALVRTDDFIAGHGDKARRVLALKLATRLERLKATGNGAFFGRGGGIPKPVAAPQAAVPQRAEAVREVDKAVKEAAPGLKQQAAAAAPPAEQPAAGKKERALAKAVDRANRQDAKQALLADEADDRAGLANGRRARRKRLQAANFVVVRVYAHEVRKDRQPSDRVDFTETLYWNAGIKTDAETGEAVVSFGLSDAVTGFRVMADAFGGSGALGSGSSLVESIEPFYVEPKLPLEVTSGDVIDLPIAFVNATGTPISGTALDISGGGLDIAKIDPFDLPAEGRVRQLVKIDVGAFSGNTDFTLAASGGPYADRVTRPLRVVPSGFPVEIAYGGMLFADEAVEHEIVIPEQIVPGSLTATATVYPTPMANMTEALSRLIREPYGCFEQTSSTTYPLVMAQQYFQSHAGIDPSLVASANEKLAKGYQRLIGFECKSGGFEWFGQDPGHEALTAYGLLEFSDMAQVYNVDTAMLDRTRAWLLKQRDGSGGFARKRRALHRWVTDTDVSNAYLVWALLESGEKAENLTAEVASLTTAAEKSENNYVLALAANVAFLAGEGDAAMKLMDRLARQLDSTGFVDGKQSIVGSGGEALRIETTSLAALAWLRDEEYIDFTDKAIRYLASACKAGRFGSTQSTVLALRAIVEHDKAMAKPKAPGSLQLVVDGEDFGEPVAFDKETSGAISLPDFRKLLTPGKHKVAVRMIEGSSMPYSIALDLHTAKPASAEECKLQLEVSLGDEVIDEGTVTEAKVVVANKSDEAIPTPVAIIGVPGGLEVRHDQLKELVKAEKIAAYEVIGREVVLYWRDMEAGGSVELPLSLVAAIPGSYSGPASRAYLYYTDEHKQWANPLHVQVLPKGGN